MFVLMSANLIAKLVFELELNSFFNTLELHAFERTVILVRRELGFKKLSDRFEGLSIEFSAQRNKLVTVILMKQHIEPLALPRALASCPLVGLWRFKAFP